MARVTPTEVRALLKDIDKDEIIDAQIEAANVLVTEKIGSNTTITTAHLRVIELWLAAHFVALSVDRQVKVTGADRARDVYMGFSSGKGLMSTTYGQTVLTLDTTGEFANTGKRKARLTTIEAIDVS